MKQSLVVATFLLAALASQEASAITCAEIRSITRRCVRENQPGAGVPTGDAFMNAIQCVVDGTGLSDSQVRAMHCRL